MLKLLKPMKFLAALLAATVLLLAACGSDSDDTADAGTETNESTDKNTTGVESDDAGSTDDGATSSDDGTDSTEETMDDDSMEDESTSDGTEDESSMDDETDDDATDSDSDDADDSESQAVFTIGETALLFDISACASPGESTVSFDGATAAGTAIVVQAADMAGAIVIDGPEGSWEGQITSVVVGDVGNVTVNGSASVADDSSTGGPEEFEVTGFICA